MATIMTKRGSLDNVVTYEHICDTSADMVNIDPNYITLGSICIVINGEDGGMEVYMANSNKEWNSIAMGAGSGDSGSGASSLIDLLDVEVLNPTDGQTLTYDATAQKWTNGGGSSGGVLEVQASFNEQTEYTTLDKTWLEINNAMNDGLTVYIGSIFTDEYDGHEITSVYKYRVNATYVNVVAGELGVTTDCNDNSGYSEFKCSGINDYPNDSYMQGEG